jgi:hypothetical protein
LHLQQTTHKRLLQAAGLCGLDVDSVNSSSDDFAYASIQVKPRFITKESELRTDIAFGDRL